MKPRILIVEDDLLMAKEISQILQSENYEVYTGATTVKEAISYIDKIDFNIVLIGIKLRDAVEGIELGAFLLQKETIPYIYITDQTDKITLEKIKTTRPFAVISKPFKPFDVIAAVSITLNNFNYKKIDIVRNQSLSIDDTPYILKEVIRFIDNNIDSNIDINHLSQLTPWSTQHFIRVFTKYIKHTPYQYVLKKKMDIAIALIAETSLPLKHIAFDLGFLSYGNFCNLFKREIGIKPDEYRKTQKIKNILNNSL